MEYKTELHCHTSEVSACGNVCANDMVAEYQKAGYSTVVVTDHFSEASFQHIPHSPWAGVADHYLTGYRAAQQAAKGKLNILLGMELCFSGTTNDYLVYGMREDFILEHPDLLRMGIEAFSKLAKAEGMLLYQAHPFRNQMKVVPPDLLFGIEVQNGNPRHDSRNDIAHQWAEKFGLHRVGGSDYHEFEDLARAGILTKDELKTNQDLLGCLAHDAYTLIEAVEE